MNSIQASRVAKTKLFFDKRKEFVQAMQGNCFSIKTSTKKGMKSVFRLNLTSDIAWEDVYMKDPDYNIFEYFCAEQFYDYTKSFKRMCVFLANPSLKMKKFPSNYHLFSRSENNDKKCEMVLAMGGNVAVVAINFQRLGKVTKLLMAIQTICVSRQARCGRWSDPKVAKTKQVCAN